MPIILCTQVYEITSKYHVKVAIPIGIPRLYCIGADGVKTPCVSDVLTC